MSDTRLFSSFSLRDLTLKNRIVVAPMTQYAAPGGYPSDWHLVHLGRFALGGAGLVLTESTKVMSDGRSTEGDLGLWSDEFVGPLSRITSFIHQAGTAVGVQLGHAGRKGGIVQPWKAEPGKGLAVGAWELAAPSAIAHNETSPIPREMCLGEIVSTIDAFTAAAIRADAAGFDAVEIHGAHGFLIHQFLSPLANRRTDGYGGTEQKRSRFALEVAESVRKHWPADKPLLFRLSCVDDAGFGLEQAIPLARALKQVGVDLIHCSSGGILDRAPVSAPPNRYGYQVGLAQAVSREADIPTMAVGHIVHAQQAEDIVRAGDVALVALGREMLYNPNWAMDAAQKLGVDADFALTPPAIGFWLSKRTSLPFDFQPSTWKDGSVGQDEG